MPVIEGVMGSKKILSNEDLPLQISTWNIQQSTELHTNVTDADKQRSNYHPTRTSNSQDFKAKAVSKNNECHLKPSSNTNDHSDIVYAENTGKSQTNGYYVLRFSLLKFSTYFIYF